MKTQKSNMRPQDIVILLKIIASKDKLLSQTILASELGMSQSEISESLSRSKFAGLIDSYGKRVRRLALMEFLQFGLAYVFPEQPGAIVRGIPTAHSASPLKDKIVSNEDYVWASAKGTVRGQRIIPLYSTVVDAVKQDAILYELLALVDALRVGRVREKEIAIEELKKYILDGE